MLVDNPTGNFQFLKGIGPFSSGWTCAACTKKSSYRGNKN